jgi:putative PIN family toxin of toxin-antitoxin system
VVLDTSILISAFISPAGSPFEILLRWQTGHFVLLVSDAVSREYQRIAREARKNRKLRLQGFDVPLFLGLLAMDGIWIEPNLTLLARSRDQNDDMFLELALAGRAGYLVTGDKDLLDMAEHPAIRPLNIVRAGVFLDSIETK